MRVEATNYLMQLFGQFKIDFARGCEIFETKKEDKLKGKQILLSCLFVDRAKRPYRPLFNIGTLDDHKVLHFKTMGQNKQYFQTNLLCKNLIDLQLLGTIFQDQIEWEFA